MQWFLDATTTGHKFALMVVAILLFAVGRWGLILFAVDRPKRVPTLGGRRRLPRSHARPAARSAWSTRPCAPSCGSFYDRDGSELRRAGQLRHGLHRSDNFQTVLRNTVLWVVLVRRS